MATSNNRNIPFIIITSNFYGSHVVRNRVITINVGIGFVHASKNVLLSRNNASAYHAAAVIVFLENNQIKILHRPYSLLARFSTAQLHFFSAASNNNEGGTLRQHLKQQNKTVTSVLKEFYKKTYCSHLTHYLVVGNLTFGHYFFYLVGNRLTFFGLEYSSEILIIQYYRSIIER